LALENITNAREPQGPPCWFVYI